MRDDRLKLAQEYQKRRNKKIVYLVLFSFGILLLALVACFIGVTDVTPIKLFNTVFHTSIKDIQPLSELETAVLVNIRLCRVTMAVVTGAGLAVCGNIMQSITGNATASPFTTGVSSAAAFGAALGIVFGGNKANITILLAFAFAAACTIAVYGISLLKDFNANSLILLGVAVNYLFSAVTCSHHLNLTILKWGLPAQLPFRAKLKQAIPACPAVLFFIFIRLRIFFLCR